LRQYIDDCLSNDHKRYDARLLTANAMAIESLIATLKSLVPPHPVGEAGREAAEQAGALGYILEIQGRAVKRLNRNFERWKRGELIRIDPTDVRRVQWRILAPDGHTRDDIIRYARRRAALQRHRFEADRLNLIYDLVRPNEVFEGTDSFEGYLVFVYRSANKAVMECGEVGNALFIVDADRWQFFSHLSKMELLGWYGDEILSYVHPRTLWQWKGILKGALHKAGIASADS